MLLSCYEAYLGSFIQSVCCYPAMRYTWGILYRVHVVIVSRGLLGSLKFMQGTVCYSGIAQIILRFIQSTCYYPTIRLT